MYFPLPVVASIIMIGILSVMILRLLLKKFDSKNKWLLFVSGTFFVFGFIFLAGTWAFLSMYLRWIFLALYVLALIISYVKVRKKPFRSKKPMGIWFAVSRTMITLIGLWLCVLYFDSKVFSGKAIELTFPFKNGTFYMMQGGSNRLSNLFHSGFNKKVYGYAMDIAELNSWGNRAKSIYSDSLDDYEIYNDTVYSPCSGKVLWLEDDVKDNKPGELNVAEVHGNHIVVQAEGYRVFMAHLKSGTFRVKIGEVVKAGQPLALLGNAGFTVEPHLHLNVLTDYPADIYDKGISKPATFKGRFLTLNDIFNN